MNLQYNVPIKLHFIHVGCYQQWIILIETSNITSSIKYTTTSTWYNLSVDICCFLSSLCHWRSDTS